MTVMPGESGAGENSTNQLEQQLETGAIPCARYIVNTLGAIAFTCLDLSKKHFVMQLWEAW